MKKNNFLKIALFMAVSTTGAFAQMSGFSPSNIGLPTGIDYVLDVPGNPTYNRLGHLQSGTYGDPSSQWAAIGVPNLNFPPANNNYYGFFSNWQSDRAFFGLRQDGVFNNSNAMIAFGDNHDNDPVPNRLIFQFDSWIPSFSKEIGTMLANGNVGFGTSTPTANLEVNSVTNGVQTAIIGKGISTGVFGEATDMNAPLTDKGISEGWSEAIGVFGKGTYATNTSNGNIYGVVGSAGATNPLNNVGVYGEAKNALGYNTGVYGGVMLNTAGIYNSGVAGEVNLNTSATWNRAISGLAPVAPNHFAGFFDGNVDVKSGVVTIGNGTLCTPAGYKLFVEEGILTEKVKVAVNCSPAWADYVFAKDYQLKPLAEVEAFILENQHLPNVPSADDLVKEGLDLGKMQAIQMEKIEELTLYLIEMKKEIEVLRKENNLLKSKN